MNPRVSVVVRTYNRAGYLADAVESVLAQTFDDLELIVVDDGSTDDTGALLDRYGGRLRRVTLPHSGNPARVMNAGLRTARGELIAFLDSDDVWLPEKLAGQVNLLDRHASAGFAYGNARVVAPDGRLSDPVLAPDQLVTGSVLRTMVRNMCVHPSTVVVRRRWVETLGGFDERVRPCDDFVFLLRLARATDAACVPEPVCVVRQHAAQYSRMTGLEMYECAIVALETLRRERGLAWSVRREARRSIARYHLHLARRLAEAGRDAEARPHALDAVRSYPAYGAAWLWWGRRLAPGRR